ncbi:hypothetical protein ACHAXT_004321 [Thalassiosira profunda]
MVRMGGAAEPSGERRRFAGAGVFQPPARARRQHLWLWTDTDLPVRTDLAWRPRRKNRQEAPPRRRPSSRATTTPSRKDFRTRSNALHAHFDRDGDGHLNHAELRGLQLLTSGSDMDAGQYVMVCRSLACDPSKGISVDALKVVYASEGASVEEDFMKVLGKGKKETNASERPEGSDDDCVLEVGEDGVDISS